jgi:amino acid adenylation domain-containing protein/thioester reductase-like protein
MSSDLSQQSSQLSPAKRLLLEKRLRGKVIKSTNGQTISRGTGPGSGPLSFAQQRLWFIEQFEEATAAYNIPFGFRLRGQLNVAALERSLNEILRRHEALRTSCTTVEGKPQTIVTPALTMLLPVKDLRSFPEEIREAELYRLAIEDARSPFNLAQSPLFRIALLQVDEKEYVLLMTIHHISFDGWSIGVFMRELTILYNAFSRGRPSPLPELPIQYADFAKWQREWLQGEVLEHQLSYWKKQLSGSLPILNLPTDRPRPARQTFRGAIHSFHLPQPLSEAIKNLSQQEKCTPFMTLLAAFKALLYRYTGQEDIIVGSAAANRNRAELENLIGFFVNTLVLRTDLSENPTFRELLGSIRKITLEAQAHQDLPFDLLVAHLHPERNLNHQPLFQVAFILQNTPPQVPELISVTLETLSIHNGTAKFDLFLEMVETEQGLTGTFEYNTDLFEKATIERMCTHFTTLLESIVNNPDQRIADVLMLSPAECEQILVTWNNTARNYPEETCFHKLFEAQVERTPEAPAVLFEQQQSTYRDLNAKANQLAHYLITLGVGPEVLVGICFERSLDMIVAILGVLKAGGAYLPIDPVYPQERIAFMLADSQVPVLLTQNALRAGLPQHKARVICLDTDWERIDREHCGNPYVKMGAEHLAYVIYTSGSTGRPKGVLITHRGLCNVCEAQMQTFRLTPNDRVLQFSSLSFDAATFEIIMALGTGATLCLTRRDNILPGPGLVQILQNMRISILTIPPSALANLPLKEFPALRVINVAGEACSANLAKFWAKGRQFLNLYGPTEATIWATAVICVDQDRPLSIGRPIANTQIYILDTSLQPVPIGIPGELHIGGVGLARGYLNRPELTAEKFIPHPFSDVPGSCLYKTGDLARYLPDGNIEFLGRIDHQVKVRGFRIELGEIEQVLRQHPVIHETVVIARETVTGDKQLAAYLVPQREPHVTISELREFLKTQLPDYMIPATFTLLERFPLTPNGKIDRRALPEPEMERPELSETFVTPQIPAEKTMADIWSSLLHVEPIGIHDNFFELGGHSLLAVQLVSKIEALFQVKLPLWRLFAAPTIAGLVYAIQQEHRQGPEKPVLDTQVIDGDAEAMLDEAICSGAATEVSVRSHRFSAVTPTPAPSQEGKERNDKSLTTNMAIFLTGATGFLGVFLLHELLQQTRADIYCLVRASSLEEGNRRLRNTLAQYLLWSEPLAHRIIPVSGDLALPRFGLSSDEFDRLAHRIEVIYHSGAQVNLLYPYAALKPVNVLGTKEILRLASLGHIKPVHYVSTAAVFPVRSQNGHDPITEDTPPGRFEDLKIGYAQSKWVAEKLIATAHARGIPASMYRPSRISGHSQTGVWNTSDFACRMIKGCIQMGIAPEQLISQENWVPVDYVSRAIVHLSRQPASWGQVFHLINHHPLDWAALVDWIGAFGYPLRKLVYAQWCKAFCTYAAENVLSPLMPVFQTAEPPQRPQQFSDWNTVAGLEGTAITCPPVDPPLLHTYFAYFLRSRFLDPPQGKK